MKNIKIGVICPSEIAFRRFMPALKKLDNAEFVGIAVANELEWFGKIASENNLSVLKTEHSKAENFINQYGGKIFESYEELISSDLIDSVYIPLPPALHFKWAKLALEKGKHVFLEKPSTTNYKDTFYLVELAKEKKLALHENYMFNFHSQIDFIENEIRNKIIGDIRLYRIAFGFPFRGSNDFRYSKKLGGGALLDCGGYTLKLATRLLGGEVELKSHNLNYIEGYDVDFYGSGTLVNKDGQVAQVAFGMDNSYKCELEVWGSKGIIYTNRILTAPEGFEPIVKIKTSEEDKEIKLLSDDTFMKSIIHFINCIENDIIREETYEDLLKQEKIVCQFMEE